MVSNNSNQEFVYCSEHNKMIHKDNAKLLMQAASEREQNEQKEVEQIDTMIAFMSGSPVPSYLPRKNIKQAGLSNNARPEHMLQTFMEFGGLS